MPRRKHYVAPVAPAPGPDAVLIAMHRKMTPQDVHAARIGSFKPAVYHIGEDYFCSPEEGEALPVDPLFAKGWQLIATYEGRSIHRARG